MQWYHWVIIAVVVAILAALVYTFSRPGYKDPGSGSPNDFPQDDLGGPDGAA